VGTFDGGQSTSHAGGLLLGASKKAILTSRLVKRRTAEWLRLKEKYLEGREGRLRNDELRD